MTELVLLHGALGAAAQFEPWLPLLVPHFNVHVLDFEGHGARPFADRPFHIDHFADNLAELLAERGLAGAHVFGYSMGGYVAMRQALRAPGSIGRIFTFATKLAWDADTAAKEARMLDPDTIAAKVPKFAAQLEARHHGNDWRGHLARTAELMRGLGARPLLQAEEFAALDIPVRLGIGDKDNMVSLEETIGAYRALPQGQLFVMPGTGHPLERIDAARICAEIVGFLGGE
jgi:pimeloyl-ACP methyl ester carboxylesterase